MVSQFTMGDWWYKHQKDDATYGMNRWEDVVPDSKGKCQNGEGNCWEGFDENKRLGSGRFWRDVNAKNVDFRIDCEYGPAASDVQDIIKVQKNGGGPGEFDENKIDEEKLIIEKYKPKALCMYEKYLDPDYDKNVLAEKSGFALILDKEYYTWMGYLKTYYKYFPYDTIAYGNLENAGCTAWTFRYVLSFESR